MVYNKKDLDKTVIFFFNKNKNDFFHIDDFRKKNDGKNLYLFIHIENNNVIVSESIKLFSSFGDQIDGMEYKSIVEQPSINILFERHKWKISEIDKNKFEKLYIEKNQDNEKNLKLIKENKKINEDISFGY